ncbi:hypothetical protein [Mucilaginibacter sp.]|uniref:hypothetical protein n=1 Tax=Mucilaginibacter sp. TaxID=1882438 RepID=UPI0035BBA5E7
MTFLNGDIRRKDIAIKLNATNGTADSRYHEGLILRCVKLKNWIEINYPKKINFKPSNATYGP